MNTLFTNEITGSSVIEKNGEIFFKEARMKFSNFDLNNEADYKEFIEALKGCGYTEGYVTNIREDGIGGCTFEEVERFWNEILKPIVCK